MLDELELAVAQVRDVGDVAGQQVVDADDRIAAIEQRFGQVRPDEAGRAGDDDTFFGMKDDSQFPVVSCQFKTKQSSICRGPVNWELATGTDGQHEIQASHTSCRMPVETRRE